MRLSESEIETIKNLTRRHFGNKAKVYLFGSRINDEKKGGDIDLFVKNRKSGLSYQNKIAYLVDLELSLGSQKIDVVLDSSVDHQSDFYSSIQHKAIEL